MNAFKRALTNIKRQPVKNGVLLFLIVILATALSGAISARQAINNTEESMLLRTPAIATVSLNVVAAAEDAGITIYELGAPPDRPTVEDIFAVGSLPYVRAYDITMSPVLYSRDLEWAIIEIDEEQLPAGVSLRSLESSSFNTGMRNWGSHVEHFVGRGVTNPDLNDIDAGLIELSAGRTFTQSEIDNAEHFVIVSQLFTETNDLYIGATIEFENIVHNTAKMISEGIIFPYKHYHEERFMAAHRVIEFEVIGIFDISREFNYHDNQQTIERFLNADARLQNRIYMPVTVAESILMFTNDGMLSILDEMLELYTHYTAEDLVQEEPWIESIFVLYDPRDLDAFQNAGSELLPGFWEIKSLRNVNSSLISSMDMIREIADFILITTTVATVATLTLIITLLLRDKRHEIGIYMSLGEKKGIVIFQFLTEVIIVSTIAIIVALFIGSGISATISRNLLEQNLIENARQDRSELLVSELVLFHPGGELPIEEALEMHNTSLDATTIFIFISVGTVVILLSTIIPIAYIVKLDPKRILADCAC